ncbi:long-chain acyl-CoA synthetase [Beijerinckia sp. GAS462]|nr:long-chain acyl-CoA synthetase [Beijerinckia sp. GAS462]
MVTNDTSISWLMLNDRVARIAGGLRDEGIEPGDRVCVLMLNRPEFLEIHYATAWAGAILVPLNFRFAAAELRDAIRKTNSQLLIADPFFAETVRQVCQEIDTLRVIWTGGEDMPQADRYERLLEADAIEDLSTGQDQSVAGIFFTGGTTGSPRGVAISSASLRVEFLELRQALEFDRSSIYVHMMPMFHLADFGMGSALTLAAGTHCFLEQFTPQACLDLIRRYRPTHLCLVPTMVSMVLDEAQAQASSGGSAMDLLSSVKMIVYGAAPMTPALIERLQEVVPGVKLRQFYGMTELAGACVTLAPEDHDPAPDKVHRMRSIGQSMATSEVKIVREDGSTCKADEAGEILVRGPLVMLGYWEDPEGTAAVLKNGWMHTGDVGSIDLDGFIKIHDRTKDMIISGGENIYSLEVENALARHPKVLQCALVGLPDEKWGERAHAVVVVRSPDVQDSLSKDFETHCRGLIAGYKIPRSWTIRSEPLPLSGVGKVQKQKLRAEIIANAG